MPKLLPLSPAEAADWIDALSPVEIKNGLLDYLRWQAAHGKILLHFAHYARILHYAATPREETTAKRMGAIRKLSHTIGNA